MGKGNNNKKRRGDGNFENVVKYPITFGSREYLADPADISDSIYLVDPDIVDSV
jgi:hypothetical protein